MSPDRIAELLEPFLTKALSESQLADISTYIDILVRWNARINLTAIRHPEDIVTRHFGESLFAAQHLFPDSVACGKAGNGERDDAWPDDMGANSASAGLGSAQNHPITTPRPANAPPQTTHDSRSLNLADIGSGPGFPGIPIKLWSPNIHVTLIESNHKKSTFLREIIRSLTLTNIDVLSTRAETVAPAKFEVVTLRAVERFETVLPTASRLVSPAGRLALLIGHPQLEPARSLLPDFDWMFPIPIPNSAHRTLLIGKPHPGEPR